MEYNILGHLTNDSFRGGNQETLSFRRNIKIVDDNYDIDEFLDRFSKHVGSYESEDDIGEDSVIEAVGSSEDFEEDSVIETIGSSEFLKSEDFKNSSDFEEDSVIEVIGSSEDLEEDSVIDNSGVIEDARGDNITPDFEVWGGASKKTDVVEEIVEANEPVAIEKKEENLEADEMRELSKQVESIDKVPGKKEHKEDYYGSITELVQKYKEILN